jgi:hypothetical protein
VNRRWCKSAGGGLPELRSVNSLEPLPRAKFAQLDPCRSLPCVRFARVGSPRPPPRVVPAKFARVDSLEPLSRAIRSSRSVPASSFGDVRSSPVARSACRGKLTQAGSLEPLARACFAVVGLLVLIRSGRFVVRDWLLPSCSGGVVERNSLHSICSGEVRSSGLA